MTTEDFIIHEYVKEYRYEHVVANLIIKNYVMLDQNDMYNKDEKAIYWIIDAPGSHALAHWIYESFIFIKLLTVLNNKYDSVKILTTNDKKYVRSILDFFNIDNEIVYHIDNYNNMCFFPQIYSLNTKNNIQNDDYYNTHLNYYINYINTNIKQVRKNKLVFLPRNDKDNYAPNDRIINNRDTIKEIVIRNNGVVLDTYNLNNIEYQFTIVNDSDKIILDFGSSFFFNCIFLKDKDIYVLDDADTCNYQITRYNLSYLYDKINNNNRLHFIKTTNLELLNEISK